MSKSTDEWMNKLVENYKLPSDERNTRQKILKESQLKNIISNDGERKSKPKS